MLVLLLLCACSAALAVPTAEYYALEEAEMHFERFMQEHDKHYPDEDEKQLRFQIFKENLEEANRKNAKSRHAVFGITQFMDLTTEEFVNMNTCLGPIGNGTSAAGCPDLSDADVPNVNAPESLDWRDYNVVSRVKNQGKCGSCYAFSSVGNIESLYAIKHRQLIELSEQQIVDCDKLDGGCHGGWMYNVFTTILQSGGIQTEGSYPYAGVQQQCRFNPGQVAVKLSSCNKYNLRSQENLKRLVYSIGPIAVALQSNAFANYRRGVISDQECNTGEINHAVLIVGYGTEYGVPYWLIKNSWGTGFGEAGYVKVARGENAHSCGIMQGAIVTSQVQ